MREICDACVFMAVVRHSNPLLPRIIKTAIKLDRVWMGLRLDFHTGSSTQRERMRQRKKKNFF